MDNKQALNYLHDWLVTKYEEIDINSKDETDLFESIHQILSLISQQRRQIDFLKPELLAAKEISNQYKERYESVKSELDKLQDREIELENNLKETQYLLDIVNGGYKSSEYEFNFFKDAANFQINYQKLLNNKKVSKKAICDLYIPFKDKYKLTDSQTLRIARKEIELSEMIDIIEKRISDIIDT